MKLKRLNGILNLRLSIFTYSFLICGVLHRDVEIFLFNSDLTEVRNLASFSLSQFCFGQIGGDGENPS
ncbi:uncharacterized protein METZ01_LOCUS38555 [marine metagenome]|uniref:Uncharacterized protein n=1 Tax=marine metagenome TaxID=408172 RepID=A0A381R1V4_9ZZZZ